MNTLRLIVIVIVGLVASSVMPGCDMQKSTRTEPVVNTETGDAVADEATGKPAIAVTQTENWRLLSVLSKQGDQAPMTKTEHVSISGGGNSPEAQAKLAMANILGWIGGICLLAGILVLIVSFNPKLMLTIPFGGFASVGLGAGLIAGGALIIAVGTFALTLPWYGYLAIVAVVAGASALKNQLDKPKLVASSLPQHEGKPSA